MKENDTSNLHDTPMSLPPVTLGNPVSLGLESWVSLHKVKIYSPFANALFSVIRVTLKCRATSPFVM